MCYNYVDLLDYEMYNYFKKVREYKKRGAWNY